MFRAASSGAALFFSGNSYDKLVSLLGLVRGGEAHQTSACGWFVRGFEVMPVLHRGDAQYGGGNAFGFFLGGGAGYGACRDFPLGSHLPFPVERPCAG